MKTRPSFLAAMAVAAASVLALSGCSGGGATTSSGIPIKVADTLTVCSDVPYEPFEFLQGDKYVGFDMDIADAIAKDLGLKVNVIKSNFESITSGLFKTKCDVAISSISITEDRKANMDFSEPYYDDDLVLVAKDGSGITSIETAKDKSVGVQQGTTGDAYAQKEGLNITSFEDGGLQVQALISGTTEASLGNQSLLRFAIKDKTGFSVVQEIKSGEQLGIAVAKGDTKMLDAVNKVLKAMKADGSLEASQKKWFG